MFYNLNSWLLTIATKIPKMNEKLVDVGKSKEKVLPWIKAINEWVISLGASETIASIITIIVLLIAITILSYLAHLITRRFVLVRVRKLVAKTTIKWDDVLVKHKVLFRLFYITPAIIVYLSASLFPETVKVVIQRFTLAYMIAVIVMSIDALLKAGEEIYRYFEIAKEKPIKGYIQILQIFLYVIGAILVISKILDRPAWGLLTGLGAMTAILILVFKDTILGLVASFQLVSNKMVKIGDWIEFPKYGADGDVIEITLNTVKIQNWDKTISTVPTYSLISDAFKNWRGMQDSGGRRIKRSIYIDMTSVKFCSDAMIERFSKIHLLKDYIQTKNQEIEAYNTEYGIHDGDISGRKMTNLGTFRAYIIGYLKNHPKIHKDMTFLVRHLASGENGLPIEIYVFSNEQNWVNYEGIQADIFDHILAALVEFDLKVFQNPTGADFQSLFTKVE